MASSVNDCILLESQLIKDVRGNLNIVEAKRQCPFEIKRLFYVTRVPIGQCRGGHAHRELEQLIICASGCLTIFVRDGRQSRKIRLLPDSGMLYIPPLIWAEQVDFTEDTVMLVVASDHYDESDYIRCYDEFLHVRGDKDNEY